MTHSEAAALLAHGRNGRKKLARNTYLYARENGIAVRLHETDVVTIHPDDSVTLTSGGWPTMTTKDRISGHIPGGVSLFASKSRWFLAPWARDMYRQPDTWTLFVDGVKVHFDGRIEGGGEYAPGRDRALKAQIRKYAAGFWLALVSGEVGAPSGGDCWDCLLREVKTGKPLGELTGNISHLRSHLQETYYVPSLLVNALAAFPVSRYAQGFVALACDDAPGARQHAHAAGIAQEQVTKSLRRYLGRQFGLAV